MLRYKILIIFILLNIMTKYSLAQSNVAYLNLDFVISNSNQGKILLENLKIKENEKIEEFKNKEKNLKNEENKILASKTIISNDALNEKVSEFKIKLKKYNEYKSAEIENIKQYRSKEILKLIKLINPIINNFMKENSISIILDQKNIFIADKNYDITNDIIKEIKKKLK